MGNLISAANAAAYQITGPHINLEIDQGTEMKSKKRGFQLIPEECPMHRTLNNVCCFILLKYKQ